MKNIYYNSNTDLETVADFYILSYFKSLIEGSEMTAFLDTKIKFSFYDMFDECIKLNYNIIKILNKTYSFNIPDFNSIVFIDSCYSVLHSEGSVLTCITDEFTPIYKFLNIKFNTTNIIQLYDFLSTPVKTIFNILSSFFKIKINKKKQNVCYIKNLLSYYNIWRGGVWDNGTWNKYYWEDGIWKDGIWKDGMWANGTWENGIWENGIWENGLWTDGVWENGLWTDGVWENGTWLNGVWENGTWLNGVWNVGWILDNNPENNIIKCKTKTENDNIYCLSYLNPKIYFKSKL